MRGCERVDDSLLVVRAAVGLVEHGASIIIRTRQLETPPRTHDTASRSCIDSHLALRERLRPGAISPPSVRYASDGTRCMDCRSNELMPSKCDIPSVVMGRDSRSPFSVSSSPSLNCYTSPGGSPGGISPPASASVPSGQSALPLPQSDWIRHLTPLSHHTNHVRVDPSARGAARGRRGRRLTATRRRKNVREGSPRCRASVVSHLRKHSAVGGQRHVRLVRRASARHRACARRVRQRTGR